LRSCAAAWRNSTTRIRQWCPIARARSGASRQLIESVLIRGRRNKRCGRACSEWDFALQSTKMTRRRRHTGSNSVSKVLLLLFSVFCLSRCASWTVAQWQASPQPHQHVTVCWSAYVCGAASAAAAVATLSDKTSHTCNSMIKLHSLELPVALDDHVCCNEKKKKKKN